MWRYYPAANNDHGYITTKTKFILEYTGSAEWSSNSWYSEEHCHVEDRTSPSATVICSTSGYHPFGILDQTLTKLVTTVFNYVYRESIEPYDEIIFVTVLLPTSQN
ncbi:Hypothetical predicted protein, partial [Paramuricea clavata]